MSDQRANVVAYIEKGLHCFSIGQFEEARSFWTKALEIEPHNAQVLEFLQYVSPQGYSTPPGGTPMPASQDSDLEALPRYGETGSGTQPAPKQALRWNSWSSSHPNEQPGASYNEELSDSQPFADAQEVWLPQEERASQWNSSEKSSPSQEHPLFHQEGQRSEGGYFPGQPVGSRHPSQREPAKAAQAGWLKQGLYNQKPSHVEQHHAHHPGTPGRGQNNPDLSTQFLKPLPELSVNPNELMDENTIQSPVPLDPVGFGNSQAPPSSVGASLSGYSSEHHQIYEEDLAAPDDAFSSEIPPGALPTHGMTGSGNDETQHNFAGPTDDGIEQPSFASHWKQNRLKTQFFQPVAAPLDNFLPPEEVGLDASGEFLSGPADADAYSYMTPEPLSGALEEVPFFQEEPLGPQQEAAVHFQKDGSFATIEPIQNDLEHPYQNYGQQGCEPNTHYEPQQGYEQQHTQQGYEQQHTQQGYEQQHTQQNYGFHKDQRAYANTADHPSYGQSIEPQPQDNTVVHSVFEPSQDQNYGYAEQRVPEDSGVQSHFSHDDLEFLLGDEPSLPDEWEDVNEDEIMQPLSEDSLELVFQEDGGRETSTPVETRTILNQEPAAYDAGTHLEQPPVPILGANDATPPAGVTAFQPDRPPVVVRQSQESLAAVVSDVSHVISTADSAFEPMTAMEPALAETMTVEPVSQRTGSTAEHHAINVFDMPTSAKQTSEPTHDSAVDEELSILLSGIEDLLAEEDFIGAKELLDVAILQAPKNSKIKILYDLCEKKVSEIFREEIKSLDATPRLCMDMNTVLKMRLNHRDGYILSQVDGLTSIADLLAISGFEEDELFLILGQLAHREVIEWV